MDETRYVVYALTDGDMPIYVGITKRLRARYRQHFSGMPCNLYITRMRQAGRIPGLRIIQYAKGKNNAMMIERAVITSFGYAGVKLLNEGLNSTANWIKPEYTDLSIKPKRLKKEQLNEVFELARKKYLESNLWIPTSYETRFPLPNTQKSTTPSAIEEAAK